MAIEAKQTTSSIYLSRDSVCRTGGEREDYEYDATVCFFSPWVTADRLTPSRRASSALDDTFPEESMDSHLAQRSGPVSTRGRCSSGSRVRWFSRG